MSWSQAILALAILILFIAWRRARAQTAAMRARIEEHRALNTFTFEAVSDASGRAIAVFDATDGRVDPRSLNWDEHGLERMTAEFAGGESPPPGTAVELMPEQSDVIEVWSRELTRCLGQLHGAHVKAVRERIERREVGSCVLLSEPHGTDGTLELLLIHAGVDVEF